MINYLKINTHFDFKLKIFYTFVLIYMKIQENCH